MEWMFVQTTPPIQNLPSRGWHLESSTMTGPADIVPCERRRKAGKVAPFSWNRLSSTLTLDISLQSCEE